MPIFSPAALTYSSRLPQAIWVGKTVTVGKLGAPGKPYYLPNDNTWMVKNRGIRYKTNPEVVTMGSGRPQSLSHFAIYFSF